MIIWGLKCCFQRALVAWCVLFCRSFPETRHSKELTSDRIPILKDRGRCGRQKSTHLKIELRIIESRDLRGPTFSKNSRVNARVCVALEDGFIAIFVPAGVRADAVGSRSR